jgi:hypothetical protein
VQKLWKASPAESLPNRAIPAVPLRNHSLLFSDIMVGSRITFAEHCPLPQLCGQTAQVEKISTYRFGSDDIASFRLIVNQQKQFLFSVAEDVQGHYLALSRELTTLEQDQWFGLDALGFFTEPSTAKTIRCKADLHTEGAWVAARYSKAVDWVEGRLVEGRQQAPLHYNLLVNETGEKSLEIEHYDHLQVNKIYVTVYRPIDDIRRISEPSDVPAAPAAVKARAGSPEFTGSKPDGKPEPKTTPTTVEEKILNAFTATDGHKAKPDFRRATEDDGSIHIAPTFAAPISGQELAPPLPSFLLSREHNYLSLDAVIAPEAERIRCGLLTAKTMIDTALQRGVRVRDVLRDIVGLDSMLSEEVVFEMPLSEADYRALAQRYKLRPDHRDEIRARLQRELRTKLLGMPE